MILKRLLENNAFRFLSFIFYLYCMLISFHADIFSQSGNFFLCLPFNSIFHKSEKISLKKLKQEAKIECFEKSKNVGGIKTTYIFVLDISKSLATGCPTPKWYNQKTIHELNKQITERGYLDKGHKKFQWYDDPTPFEFCRIKLATLLLKLTAMQEDFQFDIYEFGNVAIKAKLGKQNKLADAFAYLINVAGNIDDNTDFDSLFRVLNLNHFKEDSENNSAYSVQSHILLIFSDLLHDIGPNIEKQTTSSKENKNDLFNKSKEELKNNLNSIAKSKMLANVIVIVGQKNQPMGYQLDIRDMLNKTFPSARYNQYNISAKDDSMLYGYAKSKSTINFLYRKPVGYTEYSTFLIVDEVDNYKISLLGNENEKMPDDRIVISYELQAPSGAPLKTKKGRKNNGFLTTANGPQELHNHLLDNFQIKLLYEGIFPPPSNYFKIKIDLPNANKKSLIIPIRFVEKLPLWASIFLSSLQILFFLMSLWIIIDYCKLHSKRKKTLKKLKEKNGKN
jgi:hypothetical protein